MVILFASCRLADSGPSRRSTSLPFRLQGFMSRSCSKGWYICLMDISQGQIKRVPRRNRSSGTARNKMRAQTEPHFRLALGALGAMCSVVHKCFLHLCRNGMRYGRSEDFNPSPAIYGNQAQDHRRRRHGCTRCAPKAATFVKNVLL